MIFISDTLFESGMKTRLKGLQEVAGLLRYVNFDDMQQTGDPVQLYHIAEIIHSTIDDLFDEFAEIDGLNREAFMELKAKVPADPEQLAEDNERNGRFADYLAEQLIKLKPELEKPLKKLLAQNA